MSSKTNRKSSSRQKKTEVLRGRCERALKDKFTEFVATTPFSESHFVRQAVVELMEHQKSASPAKPVEAA